MRARAVGGNVCIRAGIGLVHRMRALVAVFPYAGAHCTGTYVYTSAGTLAPQTHALTRSTTAPRCRAFGHGWGTRRCWRIPWRSSRDCVFHQMLSITIDTEARRGRYCRNSHFAAVEHHMTRLSTGAICRARGRGWGITRSWRIPWKSLRDCRTLIGASGRESHRVGTCVCCM